MSHEFDDGNASNQGDACGDQVIGAVNFRTDQVVRRQRRKVDPFEEILAPGFTIEPEFEKRPLKVRLVDENKQLENDSV